MALTAIPTLKPRFVCEACLSSEGELNICLSCFQAVFHTHENECTHYALVTSHECPNYITEGCEPEIGAQKALILFSRLIQQSDPTYVPSLLRREPNESVRLFFWTFHQRALFLKDLSSDAISLPEEKKEWLSQRFRSAIEGARGHSSVIAVITAPLPGRDGSIRTVGINLFDLSGAVVSEPVGR